MMDTVLVQFRRKPPRRYVHGPDLFNAVQHLVMSRCGSFDGRLDVDFHALVRHQCKAHISSGPMMKAPPEACVLFSYHSASETFHGWLSEDDRPLNEGPVYDETALVSLMTLESDSTIVFQGESIYSGAEIAVTATKELHNRLFPEAGKWIVSRFSANRRWPAPPVKATVRCKLLSNLHNRLTRTAIEIDGDPIGTLSFSAVQSP